MGKTNSSKSRTIRVFISSTFRDMNAERDHLNNFIFPQICNYCEQRFLQFIPVDLRWGVLEEDSHNGLVLSSCMEEIDNSRPFFIGILGSRYGWQPTLKELSNLRASVQLQRPWIEKKISEGASITEMEREYGVLRDMNLAHACFLIRDEKMPIPDDFREEHSSEAELHLISLKERIRKQEKYPVIEYESINQLGEVVKSQIISMIETEYPPKSNDREIALIQKQDYFFEQRSHFLCKLDNFHQPFNEWIKTDEKVLLYTGPSQDFRTSIIATWLAKMDEEGSYNTLYFDFSVADDFGNPIDSLFSFIQLKYPIPQKENLIIALDRAFCLEYIDADRLVRWIQSTGSHIRFIINSNSLAEISLATKFIFPYSERRLNFGLSDDLIREYVANYFAQYGKRLSSKQTEMIVAGKNSNDPDILILTLKSLLNYNSFEDLDERIEKVVSKSTIGSFFLFSVTESETLFKESNLKKEYSTYMTALEVISLASIIKESDLYEIIGMKGNWNIVRPHVLNLCTELGDLLLLKWHEWNQNVWDMTYPKHIGALLINWFADNQERIYNAAKYMLYIYGGNMRFMDYDEDSREWQVQGDLMRKNMVALSKSPDMVKRLSNRDISYLYTVSPIYKIPMSDSPYRIIGRTVDELSIDEAIKYFQRLATIAYGHNRATDVAYCYAQIAEMLDKLHAPEAILYHAKSKLAVGQASYCINLLEPILKNSSSFSEVIALSSAQIIFDAYCQKGDSEKAFNILEEVSVKYDFNEINRFPLEIQEPILGMLLQSAYNMCYYERLEDDFIEHIIQIAEPFIKEKGIGHPYTYLYEMTQTNYYRITNQIDQMQRHAWLCEVAAVAVYGKNSFLWGRAAGMNHASHNENLSSLKNFGFDDTWSSTYTQHGKRSYSNRFLGDFDYSQVDTDVLETLERENSFWA